MICDELKNTIDNGFSFRCPPVGEDCRDGCLYNLDDDPNETTNVAKDHPVILEEMKLKLKKYSQMWTPSNTDSNPSNKQYGVFNPIRNGDNPDCAPGGKYVDKCGDDYCSDDELAYDPKCASAELGWCKVCPPVAPGTTSDCDPDNEDDPKKIHLKGCTSLQTCKKFTEETGYYSWVAPTAGP